MAYGGPLSYALDQRVKALKECHRVLKQGGYLLLSIMSLWGTMHRFLDGVLKVPMELIGVLHTENDHECSGPLGKTPSTT